MLLKLPRGVISLALVIGFVLTANIDVAAAGDGTSATSLQATAHQLRAISNVAFIRWQKIFCIILTSQNIFLVTTEEAKSR